MHDWPVRLAEILRNGETCITVTVADIRGSAPRETGSRMLITANGQWGTIGGGQLEYRCTEIARQALRGDRHLSPLQRFVLGSDCGQCCGGVANVAFERIEAVSPWLDAAVASIRAGNRAALLSTLDAERRWQHQLLSREQIDAQKPIAAVTATTRPTLEAGQWRALNAATDSEPVATSGRQNNPWLVLPVGPAPLTVVIFGAGHVGRACAQVLSTLRSQVFVVDSRPDALQHDWPEAVTAAFIAEPADFVAHCPRNAVYLVMTHDHGLDLALCEAILARQDRRFCGLIGSTSKRRRFEKRLRALGYGAATLDSLTCPIGIDGITGKHPGEIAVAVAAQILTEAADSSVSSSGSVTTLHHGD